MSPPERWRPQLLREAICILVVPPQANTRCRRCRPSSLARLSRMHKVDTLLVLPRLQVAPDMMLETVTAMGARSRCRMSSCFSRYANGRSLLPCMKHAATSASAPFHVHAPRQSREGHAQQTYQQQRPRIRRRTRLYPTFRFLQLCETRHLSLLCWRQLACRGTRMMFGLVLSHAMHARAGAFYFFPQQLSDRTSSMRGLTQTRMEAGSLVATLL